MAMARAVGRWIRPSYLPPEPDAPPPETAVAPPSRPRLILLRTLSVVGVLVLSVLLYRTALAIYTKHNDAPLNSHPDEPGKVEQLLSDTRNYNHPQLMLEAAKRLIPGLPTETPPPNVFGLRRLPMNPQTVVEQGRAVSARFAAAAAVGFALAGFAAAGWPGFLLLGLAVGLCPALLSHAHFFKEDASVMFGIACVICSGAWMIRVRSAGLSLWMTIALGVGCGLAASGKYAGAVMLGPAAVAAIAAALWRRQWGLAVAAPVILVAVSASVWAVVNYRVFENFNGFLNSFEYEKQHSQTEHRDLTMDVPTAYFTDAVWTEAMPHVKALAVVGIALLGWRMGRRQSWGFGAWLLLAGAVYAYMLSRSVIPFYRYALPVTVMLYAFAALALAWLTTLLKSPLYRGLTLATGVALIGGLQGWRCRDYTAQFADDSRPALRQWVNANLPPNTPVVTDNYAQLSNGRGWGPWFVSNNTRTRIVGVFDAGGGAEPVADLRRRGVKYVITASSGTDRFLSPYVKAVPGAEGWLAGRRQFYRDLQQCPVAWSRVAAHPMKTFANPDIIVYRLDATP